MASRWIGLARPPHSLALVRTFHNSKSRALKRKHPASRPAHTLLRAASAFALFLCTTTLGWIVFPEVLTSPAYAQALASLGREIGFFSIEPAIPPPLPAPIVDEADVHLLAATTWAEARSQGEDGMRAVAHVVVNRIGPRFGEDLETVVLRPWQFSAWNRGDPNRPLALDPERFAQSGANLATWESAQAIAREVLSGQSADPTGGALFYHTRAVRPSWARFGLGRLVIGQHVFYHDVPDRPQRRRTSARA
jgi:Cell Wall Hydrolase